MMLNKKRIINSIGLLAMSTALVFILKTFASFDLELSYLLTAENFILLISSILIFVIAVFLTAYAWSMVINFFSDGNMKLKSALHVYTKANLGKYLPGNIGHYAGRQLFGASLGISQIKMAITTVVEISYISFASLLLILFSSLNRLPLVKDYILAIVNLPTLLIVIAVIMVLSIIFYVRFSKETYIDELVALVNSRKFKIVLLRALLVSIASSSMFGATYVLIVAAATHVTINDALLIFASFTTSNFIGFITPGVPGGIGVREALLTLMLSPLYSQEIILTTAVLHRFGMILGDVASWLICLTWNKLKS